MLDRLDDSGSSELPASSRANLGEELTIGGVATSRLAAFGDVQLPKVSFIVRNWNYGRYIGRTIDSIRAQDYPNFEVVIVDNASTDESHEVIEKHVAADPRFRVVHSDVNLGPLGGALRGLELVTGDFVTFVDSDDTLLSNFASVHIQAHLASRLNVAFTSSSTLETGPDGAIVNGRRNTAGTRPEVTSAGLRPAEIVPRLRSIDDETYGVLHRNTRLLQPVPMEWPWSPGTANMYRRFILTMLAPACQACDLPKLSADGHYNRLAHLLGGSMVIDLPLSTYRIHGSNFAASTPSLAHLGSDAGPATQYKSIRMREGVRVLVANAADFSVRIGEKRYWNALAALFQWGGLATARDLADWNRDQFFNEQVRQLAATFGERRAIRKLATFIPKPLLREGVEALHGGKWPVHAHIELHLSAPRRLHARIKRAIGKRRRMLPSHVS